MCVLSPGRLMNVPFFLDLCHNCSPTHHTNILADIKQAYLRILVNKISIIASRWIQAVFTCLWAVHI